MAVQDITVTVSAEDYTFSVAQVQNFKTIRLDVEHGALNLPLGMTHDSTPGSITKPDRHLVRVDWTKQNVTTGEIATASAYTVLVVPRSSALTTADVKLTYELLRTYLTPTVAESIILGKLQ